MMVWRSRACRWAVTSASSRDMRPWSAPCALSAGSRASSVAILRISSACETDDAREERRVVWGARCGRVDGGSVWGDAPGNRLGERCRAC